MSIWTWDIDNSTISWYHHRNTEDEITMNSPATIAMVPLPPYTVVSSLDTCSTRGVAKTLTLTGPAASATQRVNMYSKRFISTCKITFISWKNNYNGTIFKKISRYSCSVHLFDIKMCPKFNLGHTFWRHFLECSKFPKYEFYILILQSSQAMLLSLCTKLLKRLD